MYAGNRTKGHIYIWCTHHRAKLVFKAAIIATFY